MAVTLVSGCSMFALSSRAPHSVRVRFSSLRSKSPESCFDNGPY